MVEPVALAQQMSKPVMTRLLDGANVTGMPMYSLPVPVGAVETGMFTVYQLVAGTPVMWSYTTPSAKVVRGAAANAAASAAPANNDRRNEERWDSVGRMIGFSMWSARIVLRMEHGPDSCRTTHFRRYHILAR